MNSRASRSNNTLTTALKSMAALLVFPVLLTVVLALVEYRLGNQVLPKYLARIADIVVSPLPFGSPQVTPSPVAQLYPTPANTIHTWALSREVDGQQMIFYRDYFVYNKPRMARWRDWLIIAKEVREDVDERFSNIKRIELIAHNLTTGEEEVWYTIDFGPQAFEYAFGDIRVIDDRLFVTAAAFGEKSQVDSGLWWADLPTRTPLQHIGIENVSYIVQEQGKWWLHGMSGDGCGGEKIYSVLDPAEPKVTRILTSAEGCVAGPRVFGVTKEALLYSDIRPSNEDDDRWATELGVMTNLKLLSLDATSTASAKVLVSEAEMPLHISKGEYDLVNNRVILLAGDKLYSYDIATDALADLGGMPVDWTATMPLWGEVRKQDSLCFYDNEHSKFAEFSLIQNKFITTLDGCAEYRHEIMDVNLADTRRQEHFLQEVAKLNLPASYKVQFYTKDEQ